MACSSRHRETVTCSMLSSLLVHIHSEGWPSSTSVLLPAPQRRPIPGQLLRRWSCQNDSSSMMTTSCLAPGCQRHRVASCTRLARQPMLSRAAQSESRSAASAAAPRAYLLHRGRCGPFWRYSFFARPRTSPRSSVRCVPCRSRPVYITNRIVAAIDVVQTFGRNP